jgi:3-oxoacyl-[acyl-carrier-protein] synthase-3
MYVPERILSNADLEKMVQTTDEWIITRTGIRERRIAAEGERCSHMGAKAALQAVERARLKPADIDLVLCATVTGDMAFPSTACLIQHAIGANGAAAFDLQAACSGFIYGLIVAEQFLRSGVYRNILLVGSERLSSVVDWNDRATCVLFGDGAGAVVLSARAGGTNLKAFDMGANGQHGGMLYLNNSHNKIDFGVPVPGVCNPTLYMAGKEVFKQAVNEMVRSATRTMEKAGVTVADLRCVISHQANMRIIEALAERLKVPEEKCFTNLQRYGNISAACIPVALHEASAHYDFQPGDKILLVAFGGGLTWASCVLEW